MSSYRIRVCTSVLILAAVSSASGVASRAANAGTEDLARIVRRGSTTERVIALTIDDGYHPATCQRMSRILREQGVAATFFPIGKNVRAHPALWAGIARHFPLVNHTMYHGLLPPLTREQIERQIRRGAQVIARVTGQAPLPVLRPPGGAWDERVRRIAGRLGVTDLILWDTTAADTSLNSRSDAMVRSALRGEPGSIVLMHCNRPLSADLLPKIVAGYRGRGFRFVTIPELLRAPLATPRADDARRCGDVPLYLAGWRLQKQ